MLYSVSIEHSADRELRAIPTNDRIRIVGTIAKLLRHEPTKESKSRIKKLRQPAAAVYRLRVGEYRVFYDVVGSQVMVLHVCHKNDCSEYYGDT
jgi:mRNA-degrading endonuclease RelE of RelBE toxin-antitoxin system